MVYYVSVPLSRLDHMITEVVDAGFHPEIRMTDVEFLLGLGDEDIARLRDLLDRHGCATFTHGPFFGLDIASLDTGISKYTHEALVKGLAVSARFDAPVMVVHTGYLPQFSRGGRRHWFRNWAERMPRVVEAADNLGVRLALENTWDDRPEVLLHLLAMLPDGVGVCLDTGHVNAFSRLSVSRWWDVLGDRIVALHLHDNDGLSDDHLAPGEGTFDYTLLARCLRGKEPAPLLDLEVDIARAPAGRDYLENLLRADRSDV